MKTPQGAKGRKEPKEGHTHYAEVRRTRAIWLVLAVITVV
jgi:hypothetical protein